MVPTSASEALAERSPVGGCNEDWHTADVVCGGFPCQDISLAGKSAGISGSRSDLWRWLCGAIRLVRPKYAIVENVAALLNRGMGTVLGDLAEIGYDSEWNCIPASNVGAPHDRDRVWIIAYPERGERWYESHYGALRRMGGEQQSIPWDRDWQGALRKFRGMDDGTAYGVDRVDSIRNAVVPQIPEIIGRAILEAEK